MTTDTNDISARLLPIVAKLVNVLRESTTSPGEALEALAATSAFMLDTTAIPGKTKDALKIYLGMVEVLVDREVPGFGDSRPHVPMQ